MTSVGADEIAPGCSGAYLVWVKGAEGRHPLLESGLSFIDFNRPGSCISGNTDQVSGRC